LIDIDLEEEGSAWGFGGVKSEKGEPMSPLIHELDEETFDYSRGGCRLIGVGF